MRRNEETVLVCSLTAYFGASLLLTVLLLLGSLASMKFSFMLARVLLGVRESYFVKPLVHDSVGFAVSAAGMALAQYYLASLLRFAADERPFLAALVSFCSLFCGLLFWRGALQTSLGAYGFSGLCVTLGVLIGGLTAVFQDKSQNPWPFSVSLYFR